MFTLRRATVSLSLLIAAPAMGQVTFPGLLHHWSADRTLEDAAGSADGVAHGAVSFGPGKFGQAFDIDANEFITFGTSTCNVGTSDFTISYWVRFDAPQIGPMLTKRAICMLTEMIDIRSQVSGIVGFEISGNGSANYTSMTATGSVTDGAWHHLSWRRMGTLIVGTMDGCITGSHVSPTIADFANTSEFTLGKSPCVGTPDGTTAFQGAMDEIQIYLRALTDAEVAALAEAGTPDLDQSGTVNAADLAIMLGAWGACSGSGCCSADLNHDGSVDAADLAVLLGAWSA